MASSGIVTVLGDEATKTVGAAARAVLAAAGRGDSALARGSGAWSVEHAQELIERFVDRPDATGAGFEAKLDQQLAGASRGALCLFAELYYLNVLPLTDYTPDTKRNLVLSVLLRAGVHMMPDELSAACEFGAFNGGIAFKTRRYQQLSLLVKFAALLTGLDAARRSAVLSDPWEFRDLLSQISTSSEPAQRHALLYIAFPDTFLPIVAGPHRRMIRDAFVDVIGGSATEDLDRDLLAIDKALKAENGPDFDFYVSPWAERWKGVVDPEPGTQRGWLVRGSSVNGRDLVLDWLAKDSVSLAATKLRDVEPGMTKDELKPIVDTDYAHTSYSSRAEKLDEFHTFLSRMQVGDFVATTHQGNLYIGQIIGEATYQTSSDGRSNLRREVEWNPDGVDYAQLPPELAARLQSQRDVLDLTQQLAALQEIFDAAAPPVVPVPSPVAVTLPDATQELADRLLVGQDWLQLCIDLLNDRPQLIFYGPPGTGKTYLAQELATFLAGDNVKLVQFHPAYSYEDFFEGYRPTPAGTFELRPGPLRKLVDQAEDDPSSPYILIIDEINRGNLAKIFGELYFLLEYRDKNIDLLYASGDESKSFTLPRNIYLIGTMNTADRSIALVDAAMRRRFAFVPLRPDEEPTRNLLHRWLDHHHRPRETAGLLDALNARIDDPDFRIGPSYFMRDAVYADDGLERVWRTAILPLLEEHHYGDAIDVTKRYGLDALRAAVASRSAAAGDSPMDEVPTDEEPTGERPEGEEP